MSSLGSLGKLLLGVVAAGLAVVLCLAPVVGISGAAVARVDETMQSNLADLTDGSAPGVTTITDKNGEPIAWIYNQRRYELKAEQISQAAKDALVAIEDRRFYEHEGVDMQGFARAMVTNVLAGGVEEGASTINQQYVKNYLLLVDAENPEEQTAAVEQSIPRKLREMRMASDLDKQLPKEEILARYMNIVPFGNHAYGIEAAARTYFGIPAAELNVPQSALLVGMLQSAEMLNPYTNPEGATERRNTVLQAMVTSGYLAQDEADRFKGEPLGVLEEPALLPEGCISAGSAGFLCDYALEYLAGKGLPMEELERGGYTIRTTLDPGVQEIAHNAAASAVSPGQHGVAEVINVIEPGENSRNILAMTSSRTYGLDGDESQTVLPQTSSMVGNGAGSVFKIFTAAAALEQGYNLDAKLPVPKRSVKYGMGTGGATGCPAGAYCVENAGSYPSELTLRDALAKSPNTTFIELLEEVGVEATVDMAVRLGLRSYEDPGSFDEDHSIGDYFRQNNLGAFTLGPTAVNPLELSNVGATLASGGKWCEPNPVAKVEDRLGQEVFIERPDCEEAVSPELASGLANGMAQDTISGTAKDAAAAYGWSGPVAAKTGTTESHQSSAFLGFNNAFAAATYIYNDGTQTTPLCSGPVRQCNYGDLFGGKEAARSWFQMATQIPGVQGAGLPTPSPLYDPASRNDLFDSVVGLQAAEARSQLEAAGFKVRETKGTATGKPEGEVVEARTPENAGEGAVVTLVVSDGSPARNNPPNRRDTRDDRGRDDDDEASRYREDLEDEIGRFADDLADLFGDL
ncbi:transglycosylase domain-containing protein [Corynebacterium genitalium ATCC 33030]|uniref:Transglycosylase n=1 Tax=Corynebacterium genitalium ATCC 33030 TaxID=585529 RepID=D7WBD6_9CORY|nr:transglycosylase domain-containing protein [Corynebacterium genitalium]EFK55167.1 transglycosylase [Corynebacterium genitalium ATCC 33030]UUA89568.1 transglycosylase domain-containing protein [Corynebacterium genitalium ATCC 33030]